MLVVNVPQVTLTPVYGDADLFVNVGGSRVANSNNADYRSMASTGNDMVTVRSTDDKYINSTCNPANANSNTECAVSIGVQGFSPASYFTLVASSTNAVVLLDGTSFSTSVGANEYREFIFEVRVPNTQVCVRARWRVG